MSAGDWIVAAGFVVALAFFGALFIADVVLKSDGRRFR